MIKWVKSRQQPHLDVGKGCVEESCCSPCDWLNLGLVEVTGERDIPVPVKFVMNYITRFHLQLTAVKGVAKGSGRQWDSLP